MAQGGAVQFTRPDLRGHRPCQPPAADLRRPFEYSSVDVANGEGDHPIPLHALFPGRPGRHRPAVYPDLESFVADTAAAYRAEIADLYAAGCRYLQLDDVSLAYLCDDAMRAERGPGARIRMLSCVMSVELVRATLRDKPRTARSARISAAATSARAGAPEAATRASRRDLQRSCRTTASSSSSTTRARAILAASLRAEAPPRGPGARHHRRSGALERKDELRRRLDEASQYVAARADLREPAVWLLLDPRRQRAHGGLSRRRSSRSASSWRARSGGRCDRGHARGPC